MRTNVRIFMSCLLIAIAFACSAVAHSSVWKGRVAFTVVGFDEENSVGFHGTLVVYGIESQSPACAINLIDQDKRGRSQPSSYSGYQILKKAKWVSVENNIVQIRFKKYDFQADGIYTIKYDMDTMVGSWKFETVDGISAQGECLSKKLKPESLNKEMDIAELLTHWKELSSE